MQRNLNSNNIIGHTMKKKDKTHTRICILNPNGISMSNNCEQHQEICNAINKQSIEYFGYPEINLDTIQQYVQQTIKKFTKAAFSQSSIQLSSTPIPAKYYFKPGGTMCLAQGDINSRKLDQGCNKYGYWSYFRCSAMQSKMITIITAYCHKILVLSIL
jgi:hypothetical protein